MTVLPHTRLFIGKTLSVVISGPHIQVLDTQTGEVLRSTANYDGPQEEAIVRSGPVRCADVDADFTHLVASGEDKQLKVWQLSDLALLSERELPKKPTEIHLTRDGQTILVSDKFGDIFSYALHPKSEPAPAVPSAESDSATNRSQMTSHENPSNGTLILGHTSLLTSFLLTEDEKYVISADRDEHIRVSWYPQGYVIERFCLGHKKFVHAVHVPKFASSMLVSGGGDPMLKIWDWMSGELLYEISIAEVVEPFIKVCAPRGRWGRNEGNAEIGEKIGRRRRRRGKKGKGKVRSDGDREDEGEDEDDAMSVVAAEEAEDGGRDEDAAVEEQQVDLANSRVSEPEKKPSEDIQVLVIHRVASMDIPGQGRFLVFNAVGATAMFFCSFPTDFASPSASVEALQLTKPVIDFTIDDEGRVWVLVDGGRDENSQVGHVQESIPHLVRLLKWSEGKLVEDDTKEASPLFQSLNSACRLSATTEELKALDLYSSLSSMPKHVDSEYDPFEGPTTGLDGSSSRTDTPQTQRVNKKRKAKESMTRREQARMKKKQAVLTKLQEQAQSDSLPESSAYAAEG